MKFFASVLSLAIAALLNQSCTGQRQTFPAGASADSATSVRAPQAPLHQPQELAQRWGAPPSTSSPGHEAHQSHEHQDEAHQHGGARDSYQCPMHPEVVSDKPGDCPICGMTLEKQESK